jgi:O-antigen/teichoic acid export membrane protein
MNVNSSAKSEPVKFARDIIWVGLSQVLTTALGIITLPAFTKSYTTEMYGIWVQVSVTVSLIVPLLTLQLGSAAVRFLAGEDDKTVRRRSLGTMLTPIFTFSFLVMMAAYLFAGRLSIFLFDSPVYTTFVRLTFLWTFTNGLFSFFISYLRARARIQRLSVIQVLNGLSKMAIIVILAREHLGLEWIFTCMILADGLFSLVLFFIIVREEGFPAPGFSRIKEFLELSLPQIPGSVLLWVISASDRYFITHFLNLTNTGIYSSSRTLGSLISLFYAPIGFVLLPVVSKAWEKNRKQDVKEYFEYSTRLFLTMAVPAAAGLAILSQPLLKLLTTTEYLVGWELVLLVAVGSIFMGIYLLNSYIILLIKQTRWIPAMILVASAISIGINIVLIPRIGILGAAVSNIASYFALAAIVTFWTRKVLDYRFDFKYLGKTGIAVAVMSICIYFFKVDSVIGIVLALIGGSAVFMAVLFLLRAFTDQDKRLVKQTLGGLIPVINKK